MLPSDLELYMHILHSFPSKGQTTIKVHITDHDAKLLHKTAAVTVWWSDLRVKFFCVCEFLSNQLQLFDDLICMWNFCLRGISLIIFIFDIYRSNISLGKAVLSFSSSYKEPIWIMIRHICFFYIRYSSRPFGVNKSFVT